MFDPILFARAQTVLSENRTAREAKAARRRDEIYAALPEIADIDAQMRSGLLRAVKESFSGGTAGETAMEACRERNLALKARRIELLVTHNHPPNATDTVPDCSLCDDTGFSDGKPCSCLKQICSDLQLSALDRRLDFNRQCFESFDLSLFSADDNPSERESPRDRMNLFLEYCHKYARRFDRDSANLLLRGGPGLGKSFLCACIAGVVGAGPHWVIYETASAAVGFMETEKFSRDSISSGLAERLFLCDLLLLDDLGAEFSTPFAQSALLQLLSARMAEHRPTIAVTVLTEEELRRRYPAQLVSRLDAFELLPFFGTDLRRK